MSKIRQQRTADQILRELSNMFLRDISDPRLHAVTVTNVSIDRELEHANIFINALGDDSREREVMEALQRATGFLRRELAGRIRMRSVPHLHFHWDPTLAHAEQVDEILNNLIIPPPESEEE